MKNELRLLCVVARALSLRLGPFTCGVKEKFHFLLRQQPGMGQYLGLHRYCNDMDVICIITLSNDHNPM